MSRAQVIEVATCLADGRFGRYTEEVRRVTEGRAEASTAYSWCGDFPTYCLQYAGIADGSLQNRVSINGVWRPGENISMLCAGARQVGMLYAGPAALAFFRSGIRAGDILVIQRPAGDHVGIFKQRFSDSHFQTWDGNGIGGTTRTTDRSLGLGHLESPILAVISLAYWFPSESAPTPGAPYFEGTIAPNDGAGSGERA